jgi:hypothetical protein
MAESLKRLLSDDELKAILFSEFPPLDEITVQTREENLARVFTGGVRINAGMYRTVEEDRRYRVESLKRKLP